MATSVFKVMLTELTECDPLRQMYDARFFDIHYRLRILGTTIEILNADLRDTPLEDMPIGRILGSPSEGSIWRGDLSACIARYTFDEAQGYVVIPIENGIPQPEKATAVHPIDYFFAYWRDLSARGP